MRKKPKVIIIGQPNVGKSTLINRILNKKHSITLEEPGVTRDLVHINTNWHNKEFILIDSGGIWLNKTKKNSFQEKIEKKVTGILDDVNKIIFVTDINNETSGIDQQIAKKLQKYKEKVILVVNKIDILKAN